MATAISREIYQPALKDYDDIASYVKALTAHYGVHLKQTQLDVLADDISRLSESEYRLDDIAEMLIALQRNGFISNEKALQLQASHLASLAH